MKPETQQDQLIKPALYMKKYLVLKLFCFISLACLPIAAGAQIEFTGAQIDFNHVKSERYDVYSLTEVNPADSTFDIRVTIEGDNVNIQEMYDALFCELDSIMYSQYGDKYDNKAREEYHKKLLKDLKNLKKKHKKNVRENKKLSRSLKKSLKKELKEELKRP